MNKDGSWNALVAIGGAVWIALFVVAIFGVRAPNLPVNATASEIAALYRDQRSTIAANNALLSIGILGLIVFISGLWSGLRGTTSADHALVTVALVCGAVFATTLLLSVWLHATLAFLTARSADAASLLLVQGFDQVLGVTNDLPFGAFIATFGLAMLRTRAMPRWLGGLGMLAGGCFLVASLGSLAAVRTIEETSAFSIIDGVGALLFNLWLLVTSILAAIHWRRAAVPGPAAAGE
jgi:hypothetical protein